MIRDDVYLVLSEFQVVTPYSERFEDSEKLFIMNVIVKLCWSKRKTNSKAVAAIEAER